MAVLNTLSVGATVSLNVGGVATDFLLVHKGNPSSSIYDSSCDGAWLTTKDLYTYMAFGDSKTCDDFSNSDLLTYLNGTFLNLLDEPVRNVIKDVKIPYTYHYSGAISLKTGANGLSCKVFVPSAVEVDGSADVKDGANLSYFSSNTNRVARYDGIKDTWWTRTNYSNYSSWGIGYVSSSGAVTKAKTFGSNMSEQYCVRPTFILPLDIDPDNLGGISGKVNVGGAWKDVSAMKVNVGGVWKDVSKIYTNVGGVWKE